MSRSPSRALALLFLLCSVTLAAPTLDIATDRADALYHAGETATFTIKVLDEGQPVTAGKLSWSLSKDGVGDLGKGVADPAEQPLTVTGTLAEPGVLRLTVNYADGDTKAAGFGGAGYDLDQLRPAAPAPDDFDAWWQSQKDLLAAIPMDAQVTVDEARSTEQYLVAEVSLANIDGSRVHGWYGRPRAAGKYPAMLQIPGASYGPFRATPGWAHRGFISLYVSVHDQPLEPTAEEVAALKAPDGALYNYFHQGRESRDTYYFRRVFLSFVRAIDFLTSQAEWDGEHMLVSGSSQGGGSTLVTAGLDPRVTAGAANVPALCDHKGLLIDRASGWPRLIPNAEATDVITTAGYFDAAYFASRITCPMLVSVGLIDRTCPATSVLAAYNAIPHERKQLLIYPKMGHEITKDWTAAQDAFLLKQAGLAD